MPSRPMTLRPFVAGFTILLGFALLAATPLQAQEASEAMETPVGEQKTADDVLKEGQGFFEEGDFETAAATFSGLIGVFEREGVYQPVPYVFRAKTYAQLEDYEAAIEDLKKAQQYAQGDPRFQRYLPEIQNTRAEIYMELEAYQAALPDLQEATKGSRFNPQYQFNLGKAMVKLGGAEPGEKALTKYLEAQVEGEEDQKAEALRLRAQAYGGMRKFPEAMADLDASLEIEPQNYEAFFVRAQLALNDKDYDKAVADLQKAIEYYEPKEEDDTFPFAQGYLTLASVLEEQGKEAGREGDQAAAEKSYAAMKEQIDKLLDAASDEDQRSAQVRVAAYFRRGVAERLLGDFGAAVKSFSLALELNPSLGEAYFRRGICFHFMGEEKLAVRDFEQAASINFDSPRANLWKGMSYAKGGNYQEAIRAYGESIAVSDRYTPAYVNRGLAHMADADYSKAIDDFNEAIRLQPTEALHYYRRGKAQALAGEREKAIQSFMNAIEFDTQMRPAYDDLASELAANGQSALANEYRRRAAQMDR